MSSKKQYCLFFFLGLLCVNTFAQNTISLTLDQTIELAKKQSPSALKAKNIFKNSYWQYNMYNATKLPSLTINSMLPVLERSIDKIIIPNGDFVFTDRQYISTATDVSLDQNLFFTGGRLSLSSGLQTLRNFGASSTPVSFLSNPLKIGIVQPLFAFNQFKWDNKIEPLRYQKAKKQYLEDIENLSIEATQLFFNLLSAQTNLQIAKLNKWNNDTLFAISKGRFNIGKIAENELLQMELGMLNSNNALIQAELDLQINSFKLKSFLGIKENVVFDLKSDLNFSFFKVDLSKVQTLALQNRPAIIENAIQTMEASKELARAKRENRFGVNLSGSYGLTQSSLVSLEQAYQSPQDQQQVSLGLQIPVLNWGRFKARVKMAEANQELVQTVVDQSVADFEQDIFLKVSQFNMQQNFVNTAAKADTIASKRFEIVVYRYKIGKVDIQMLTTAQAEKDGAKKNFIDVARRYWLSFYEIRKIALFDFVANKPLEVSFDDLIK